MVNIVYNYSRGRKIKRLNRFGWSIVEYKYAPQKVPQKKTWVCFIEKFQELPQNVQTLIIEKLHGNTKTWCIQHKIVDYRCI
jgi:hypothetical protein